MSALVAASSAALAWSRDRTVRHLRERGVKGPLTEGFVAQCQKNFAFGEALAIIEADPVKREAFRAALLEAGLLA